MIAIASDMATATAPATAPAKPKRSIRPWTRYEGDQLRAEYPAGDLVALAERLGRTYPALSSKACALGLRRSRRALRGTWVGTPEIDGRIRDLYGSGRVQHNRAALARSLGWPPWAITRRAVSLGLATPRKKEPPWSEAELALLERYGHLHPRVIAKKLRAHGFVLRTWTAIVIARKRRHLTAPNGDGYSSRALAQALGVDNHFVARAIERGDLRAEKRGTDRTPQQGGDAYWIKTKHVREFVIENVSILHLGRMDKHWLVGLLTGRV